MNKRPGTFLRVVVAGAVIGAGALLLAAAGCDNQRAAKIEQRRRLNNHAKHIALNIDCSGCHTGARDEAQAGLPSVRMCGLCHKPDRKYPPTPAELAEHIKSNKEIEWVRPNRTVGHAYFSHKAHVKYGKMDCAECHGQVTSQSGPDGPPLVPPPRMNTCIACHQKNDVSIDCLKCHK